MLSIFNFRNYLKFVWFTLTINIISRSAKKTSRIGEYIYAVIAFASCIARTILFFVAFTLMIIFLIALSISAIIFFAVDNIEFRDITLITSILTAVVDEIVTLTVDFWQSSIHIDSLEINFRIIREPT